MVMCAAAGGSRTKKRRCFVAAGLAARWAMRFDTSPRFGTVENTVLRGLFAGEICISRGKLSVICISVFYYNPINASKEVSSSDHRSTMYTFNFLLLIVNFKKKIVFNDDLFKY